MNDHTTKYCQACGKQIIGRNPKFCNRSCVTAARETTHDPSTDTYRVALNKGHFTVIDAADVDLVSVKWFAHADGATHYATRNENVGGRFTTHRLHKLILERAIDRSLKAGEYTDHIDGDGLNNRRLNLRVATKLQNNLNQRSRKSASGYKGVTKANSRWRAVIRINGHNRHLGMFDTPQQAHDAYMEAARDTFGEFATDRK